MENSDLKQMKWWGWGDEQIEIDMSDKPELWPFIKNRLGITDEESTPPVRFEDIDLPEPNIDSNFLAKLSSVLGDVNVTTGKQERLVHAYGKSFRDLWRIRKGIVETAPDCVVYPETEDDVVKLVQLATEYNVIVIPFGGGSNIAGCLEARGKDRMVVSLDMKHMRRVLEVDKESCTARIEAGVLGPDMERQLNGHGVTLGHFPDSFEYSTLGGWIATRSAGMQSDKYGKIEDMVVSLRMVTPNGTIVTRTVPKASSGIDIKHLCIGSEGILGVITEATMQVHHLPECRESYGYLFPDFESGFAAIHECREQECQPSMVRLSDPVKTALSFAYKSKSGPLKKILARTFKTYMKQVKRFDFDKVCLLLTIIEGEKKNFTAQRKKLNAIYKKHGAVNLGTEPGRAFERGKYDFPYLRDYVMDRNVMADVSETATVWSNSLSLYYDAYQAIEKAMHQTGREGFVGCHISHCYQTGTSLYFTFGCLLNRGQELQQYLYIKKAVEDAFMRNNATLSHHHAVGYEHMPWIRDELSETGIKAIRGLKSGLDPRNVMNPGKIIPPETNARDWGLTPADIEHFEGNGAAKQPALKPEASKK